ncbi:MAG TPA: mRNA surveillance protein pelota [Candidatus Bathyarchaeia archaeon]|nr:mRNA surveillance protein pelota [Candidatus Bathyarchaeia archaeon]
MNIKSRKYINGFVTLIPETIDDLYVLYNVILPGDLVKSRTLRRVRLGDDESRADKGDRVPMILTLEVEEVKFHEFANRLRIKGKITEGPDDLISYGTYHTFNIEIGTMLTIYKESWSKTEINRIEDAVKKSSSAKVLIVAIDDNEATLAAVSAFSTNIIVHFKERIPKKAGGKEKIRTEMIAKFYAKVTFAIEDAYTNQFQDTKSMVLAGPGFTKDYYYQYLKNRKNENKIPLDKIIMETASCGGPSAISEILSKNILGKIMEEEQANLDAVYLEEFMTRIGKNTRTVAYGTDAIKQAVEFGAVETLLMVDNQLRLKEKEKRKALDDLLSQVQKNGGKIVIMSENHPAGKQVEKFGGKIALLRFPIN